MQITPEQESRDPSFPSLCLANFRTPGKIWLSLASINVITFHQDLPASHTDFRIGKLISTQRWTGIWNSKALSPAAASCHLIQKQNPACSSRRSIKAVARLAPCPHIITCLTLWLLWSLRSDVTSPERPSRTIRRISTKGKTQWARRTKPKLSLPPTGGLDSILHWPQPDPHSPGSASPAPGGSRRYDPAGIPPSPKRWYSSGCSRRAAPVPGRPDRRWRGRPPRPRRLPRLFSTSWRSAGPPGRHLPSWRRPWLGTRWRGVGRRSAR